LASVQRYLAPSDFSSADTWRLLEWCRQLGADEFSIDCNGSDARMHPKIWRPFEKKVHPFARGKAIRERMSGVTADDLTRPTQLWELNQKVINALRSALPEGLLAYDPGEHGCFEDPVVYRNGHLLLGVLSHEAFAILRLSDSEAVDFGAAGFPSHESLPRAG
jgi:hypothetical protein